MSDFYSYFTCRLPPTCLAIFIFDLRNLCSIILYRHPQSYIAAEMLTFKVFAFFRTLRCCARATKAAYALEQNHKIFAMPATHSGLIKSTYNRQASRKLESGVKIVFPFQFWFTAWIRGYLYFKRFSQLKLAQKNTRKTSIIPYNNSRYV